MIERSLERFGLYPSRLLGDCGYGSAEVLGWLAHERGIEPHVTVYDHAADVYPAGKVLTTSCACERVPRCFISPASAIAIDAH